MIDFNSLIFIIGQYALVLFTGYLLVLGLGQFTINIKVFLIRYYQAKKIKLKEKIEYQELKEHLEEIEKVEPNDNL